MILPVAGNIACDPVPHGLADAVILPYIVEYNSANTEAADRYKALENELGIKDFVIAVKELNKKLNIPSGFSGVITNKEKYYTKLEDMAVMALNDGCTKTNPIIPHVLTEYDKR